MGFPSPFTDATAATISDRPGPPAGGGGVAALFAATAGVVVVVTIAFLIAEGEGRSGELLLLGAGTVLAYAAGRSLGLLGAVGLGAALLLLEAHHGRLDGDGALGALALAAAGTTGTLLAVRLRERFTAWNGEPARRPRAEPVADADGSPGTAPAPPRTGSLDLALQRALHASAEVSLLLVRPDALEELAERHGQEATRAVLDQVQRVLRRHLRASDELLRQSLFDFWVILPDAPVEVARATAERARLAIAGDELVVGPERRVPATLSIGIASSSRDGSTARLLAESAQRALGAAVELGGNRTILHTLSAGMPRGWGLDYEPRAIDEDARVVTP